MPVRIGIPSGNSLRLWEISRGGGGRDPRRHSGFISCNFRGVRPSARGWAPREAVPSSQQDRADGVPRLRDSGSLTESASSVNPFLPGLRYFPRAESFRAELEGKSDGGRGVAGERGSGGGEVRVSSYSGPCSGWSWRRLPCPASVGELPRQKGEGGAPRRQKRPGLWSPALGLPDDTENAGAATEPRLPGSQEPSVGGGPL